MSLTAPQIAICFIGIFHIAIMVGELYPWERPWIMARVLEKWSQPLDLSINDTQLVASIVHNAGIYNGIVGAGLIATASIGPAAFRAQLTLLAGGVVAGLFGAKTLSVATIGQAFLGAIALIVLVFFR
jgi:uncharacterized membrane protein